MNLQVVTVPDFDGPRRLEFEWRSLLFLASWLEYAGDARRFPLHLACIGEPPASVKTLCARCDASYSVHPPVQMPKARRHANKLRGLEANSDFDHVLLLDTDIIFLGDFSELAATPGTVRAAPAIKPRLAEQHWKTVFSHFSLTMPEERIPCVRHRLGLGLYSNHPFPTQRSEMPAMVPYYNSGIILAPEPSRFRVLWEEAIRELAVLSPSIQGVYQPNLMSDQTALSVIIEQLRQEGFPFLPLPVSCHTTGLHFMGDEQAVGEACLYHAFSLAKSKGKKPVSAHRVIPDYVGYLKRRTNREGWMLARSGNSQRDSWRRWMGARRAISTLSQRLTPLWNRHIGPALRELR